MSIYAGQQLRHTREALGLTLRDVEAASSEIAARHANQEFFIPFSRLSEIETKGTVPSIYRVYTLAAIYRCDYRMIFRLYDIKLDSLVEDSHVVSIPKTHRFNALPHADSLSLPVAMDPGFDTRRTVDLTRMIQRWGAVPLQFVDAFSRESHIYAFVGTEDFTMYPLVMPASFLQVDVRQTEIMREGWRNEYERPIYFLETRNEFICSWCNITEGGHLVIQPHPMSPVLPRIFRYPQDAEVIGQVVGVAMQLSTWKAVDRRSETGAPARLN
jgi:transcriptional regulator with XRE-family HTH domain